MSWYVPTGATQHTLLFGYFLEWCMSTRPTKSHKESTTPVFDRTEEANERCKSRSKLQPYSTSRNRYSTPRKSYKWMQRYDKVLQRDYRRRTSIKTPQTGPFVSSSPKLLVKFPQTHPHVLKRMQIPERIRKREARAVNRQ